MCFEEEGGWDKDNVSSSVLLLVFVQHLLLLIRVLFLLNKREIEDDELAMITMRDGDGWDEEKVTSFLLHLVLVLNLLLLIL